MFWRVYHRQNCGLHLFAGRAGEFGWALFSVSLLVGLGGVGFCLPSRLRLRRSGLALGCVCSLALVLGLGGSSLTVFIYWKTTRSSKIFILRRISRPACLDRLFCLDKYFCYFCRFDSNIRVSFSFLPGVSRNSRQVTFSGSRPPSPFLFL